MLSKSSCRISYILCTKNKLTQLKCIVPDLIAGSTVNDEIIVFDGQSSDGSHEYLQGLFDEGKFAVYRSEKDKNQAHALNKAVFCARGEVIKVILDDDALDYAFMEKAADFFHEHSEIDALGANIGVYGEQGSSSIALDLTKQEAFERWRKGDGKPFWFQDQSYAYRRSSIPLVGLWHTGVNCIDVEMTLRLTTLKQARLAWYTGTAAVRILNEGSLSNSVQYNSRVPYDFRRLYAFFGVEVPDEWKIPTTNAEKLRNAIRLRTRWRALTRSIKGLFEKKEPPPRVERSFAEIYEQSKEWLTENSAGIEGAFLY